MEDLYNDLVIGFAKTLREFGNVESAWSKARRESRYNRSPDERYDKLGPDEKEALLKWVRAMMEKNELLREMEKLFAVGEE
ncbi:hypothetical protein Pan258_01590 [Symmachiella dynata]|nr:hypothetical protein Pan258_01590 [Symmachiella dynata]